MRPLASLTEWTLTVGFVYGFWALPVAWQSGTLTSSGSVAVTVGVLVAVGVHVVVYVAVAVLVLVVVGLVAVAVLVAVLVGVLVGSTHPVNNRL